MKRGVRDEAALVHELEVHQAELEVQNQELRAANEELRRTNEALAIALDRFRALYERSPTPYFTVDIDGTIVDVNQAGAALVATPRDRLLSGTIDVFLEDEDRARFRRFLEAVFRAGYGRCADEVRMRTESAPVDALIDGVVLADEPGVRPRCVLAFVDITARRLAERARRQAQDEVLAIVSHDLRGPLNAIDLACDALAMGLEPDDHRECVSAIERASDRCERLIANLLGVAHLESGRLTLDLAPVDVSELVQQVCRDHATAVSAAGSTLTVAIDDLPPLVVGDHDRLHQVLSNLIGNALVHARGSAIVVSVATRADHVVIAVSDDGPGITDVELPHVFEQYRQGSRHHGGAGLGLAIVKGLAVAHGGTATVISRGGRGATFEIALPCRGRE